MKERNLHYLAVSTYILAKVGEEKKFALVNLYIDIVPEIAVHVSEHQE